MYIFSEHPATVTDEVISLNSLLSEKLIHI